MKKALIIAACLFALGALLFGVGALLAEGDMSVLNIETGLVKIDLTGSDSTGDAFRYACHAEGMEQIKIDAVNADVTVRYGDGEEIRVLSDSAEGVEVTQSLDGTLVVTQKKKADFTLFMIDFGRNAREITVLLPAGFAPALTVSTVSGDLKLEADTLDETKLKTTSGDISIPSLACRAFSAETVSGDLELGNLTADTFSVSTTSGDVDFDLAAAPGGVHLSSVSGDMDGTLSGAREDYAVSVSTVSGDTGLASGGEGPIPLTASTVSGDIDVRFVG